MGLSFTRANPPSESKLISALKFSALAGKDIHVLYPSNQLLDSATRQLKETAITTGHLRD